MGVISTGIKLIFGTAAAGSTAYVGGVMYPDKTASGLKAVFQKTKELIVGKDPKDAAADNKETPADKKEAPTTAEQTPDGSDPSTWQRIKTQGAENRQYVSDLIDNPISTIKSTFTDESKKEQGGKTTPLSFLGNLLGGKNAMGDVDFFSILKTGGVLGAGLFLLNAARGGGAMMSSAVIIAGIAAAVSYREEIGQFFDDKVSTKLAQDGGFEVNVPGMDNNEPAYEPS